jgi:hypothetical protein
VLAAARPASDTDVHGVVEQLEVTNNTAARARLFAQPV